MNKATAEQVLAATRIELERIHRHLIICRNRQYRETGNYADDLGAAIARTDFLLRDLMAGLVSPAAAKAEAREKIDRVRIQ